MKADERFNIEVVLECTEYKVSQAYVLLENRDAICKDWEDRPVEPLVTFIHYFAILQACRDAESVMMRGRYFHEELSEIYLTCSQSLVSSRCLPFGVC